jgi:hypothetical protein
MSATPEMTSAELSVYGNQEEKIAASLVQAADEVEHADCFDTEQRAEVYTILKALQADTEIHRGMVSLLTRKLGEYVSDA